MRERSSTLSRRDSIKRSRPGQLQLKLQNRLQQALELSDKPDLRLEAHAEFLFYCLLCDGDQLPHIGCGCTAKIDHDVCVNVGYLRTSVAISLEPALIDQTAGTHSLDLLEDRPCTGVELKPRMSRTTPAQILLHDAMHQGGIAALE